MTFTRLLIATLLVSGSSLMAEESGSSELTIVTLGDSITRGFRPGVTKSETFSAILQDSLREGGIRATVINRGIGGERTDQALARLDTIIALKPDLVTVMYGTNDSYVDKGKTASRLSAEAYGRNLVEIVRRLRDAGIRPVLMTEPRYAVKARPNGLGEHPNLRLKDFVAVCRKVAKQQEIPLIDQFADWTTAEANGQILLDWTTDGCHPNPKGHLRMAQLMDPVFRQLLATSVSNPGTPITCDKLNLGQEPVNVVCFGDSVTGLYYHTGGRRAYTDLLLIALRRLYPSANVRTINAGISGNTTQDGLARIEGDVLAKQPSVVTVMFGLNDMTRVPLEDYRDNLVAIVDRIRGVGSEVILCTPNSVITTSSRPTEKLEQYCDVVRAVASEQNIPLCDCYAWYQSLRRHDARAWRLLMSDEIHPNCSGHKTIAEQIARTMTRRKVSLQDVAPLQPAIPHTLSKLKEGTPVRILAMPPLDRVVEGAFKSVFPEAMVDVTTWPVDGMSLSDLEQDAKARVRQFKPDLVLISPPRKAMDTTWEDFVKSFAWIMNWSLSFGRQQWDVVVAHPSVSEPMESAGEFDDLIRTLVNAQDLTLIARPSENRNDVTSILATWLQTERQNAQE